MIPRWVHHVYAVIAGYFWLPCPNCGRMFGSHESDGGCLWDDETCTNGRCLCPKCPDDWVVVQDPRFHFLRQKLPARIHQTEEM